jgi:hypothetical protein
MRDGTASAPVRWKVNEIDDARHHRFQVWHQSVRCPDCNTRLVRYFTVA